MNFFDSQVSVFPGFMHISFHCPGCGHRWEGVSFVGNMGITCPKCGLNEPGFVWLPDEDSPDRADMPHDGCWLTGCYDFPEWRTDDDADEDEHAIIRQRAPWYMRILFFLIGLWVVRHGQEC